MNIADSYDNIYDANSTRRRAGACSGLGRLLVEHGGRQALEVALDALELRERAGQVHVGLDVGADGELGLLVGNEGVEEA